MLLQGLPEVVWPEPGPDVPCRMRGLRRWAWPVERAADRR